MTIRFRDLRVWQCSVELATEIYKVTATFPPDERFGLVSQLRRAAVSIPANISEGYGRATRGEYLNQLSVAKGSLNELETLVELSERLGFATPEHAAQIKPPIEKLQGMLTRLRTRLK